MSLWRMPLKFPLNVKMVTDTFFLTKERANLAEKVISCVTEGSGRISAKLRMPQVDFFSYDFVTGKYINCRVEDSLLRKALETAASAEVYDSCRDSAERDFYVDYALVRIESLFREFPLSDGCMFSADLEDPCIRTAALITAAETGVLDVLDRTKKYACRISNPRRDVARLFYEIDRSRKNINEIDTFFYRAVFAFLGGTRHL